MQLIIIIAMIDAFVHMFANAFIVYGVARLVDVVVIGITHYVSRWPVEFKDLVLLLWCKSVACMCRKNDWLDELDRICASKQGCSLYFWFSIDRYSFAHFSSFA